MATYPPPTGNLNLYNPNNFPSLTGGLTTEEGDLRYLRLTGGTETGAVLFNAGLTTTSATVSTLLRIAAGTVAAPSLAFSTSSTTGIYRSAADNFDIAIAGVNRFNLASTGATIAGVLSVSNGTSLPSYIRCVSTNTGAGSVTSQLTLESANSGRAAGIVWQNTATTTCGSYFGTRYQGGSTITQLTLQGSSTAWSSANAGGSSTGLDRLIINIDTGAVQFSAGTVSLPSITFSGDTNCGIYSSAADNIDFATNGVNRLNISNTGIIPSVPIAEGFGTAANPTFTFNTDSDTGMYHPATNTVGLSGGGTLAMSLSNTQITNALPMIIPSGAVGAPSIAISGSTTSGLYSSAANTLNFAISGVNQMTISSSGVSFASSPTISQSKLIIPIDSTPQLITLTAQLVTFLSPTTSVGSDLSFSSNVVTVNTTGVYLISYSIGGGTGSIATDVVVFLELNNTGSPLGLSSTCTTSYSAFNNNASGLFSLTATNTLRIRATKGAGSPAINNSGGGQWALYKVF